MANLIALSLHCAPGTQAILDPYSHVYGSEAGGMSAVAGVLPKTIENARGRFDSDVLARTIRECNHPRLVWIENTHNVSGGAVWTVAQTKSVSEVCGDSGLALHIDGARILNATIALGVAPCELAAPADTLTVCLSKGLCCPMGALLIGPLGLIERARALRVRFGGSLRQSGMIAAAALVALKTGIERLQADHDRAKELVEGFDAIDGLRVERQEYQTNMINVDVSGTGLTSTEFTERLHAYEVLVLPRNPNAVRVVTHRHVAPEDIGPTLRAFQDVAARRARPA